MNQAGVFKALLNPDACIFYVHCIGRHPSVKMYCLLTRTCNWLMMYSMNLNFFHFVKIKL